MGSKTETASKGQLILAEQVRLLFAALPLSAAATAANAAFLVFIQWRVIDHDQLLGWLGGLLLIVVFRLGITLIYKRLQPSPQHAERWRWLFNTGAILAALFWGYASLILFPQQSIEHQVFLAFVIAGMCAGAVTTLSFLLLPVVSFLCLSLLPLIWNFFTNHNDISIVMSIMVALFFVSTLTSARNGCANTRANIAMRLDADEREKVLYESEARYRSIFASAPLGIIHYDSKGKILECNTRLGEMLGCSPLELIGKTLFESITNTKLLNALRSSLEGENGFFQGSSTELHPGKDTPIRAFYRGIIQSDGSIISGVAVIEDLTEDYKIERMKTEFVATVSHELRTPLTAIIGSLKLLQSGGVADQNVIQELINNAQRNSHRLLMLINDILDFEKISAGKMEYQKRPLRVMEFAREALEHNAAFGHSHDVSYQITLGIDEDIQMMGDHHRLMQVMSNLLSNATKFSTDGQTVELLLKHDEEYVTIAVRDHGTGIPQEFRDKIFERFSQADSSSVRPVGGTGLGLNISRAIVEHHGGRIWFDTKIGQGSCFHFTIPLAETTEN